MITFKKCFHKKNLKSELLFKLIFKISFNKLFNKHKFIRMKSINNIIYVHCKTKYFI